MLECLCCHPVFKGRRHSPPLHIPNQDTDVRTSSLKREKKHKKKKNAPKMKDTSSSGFESEMPHVCGWSCLGPLTFDCRSLGAELRLSHGGLVADRAEGTFKNGLVFSSRPVLVQERLRLRVQRDAANWHGALRVGFTNKPPSARPQPLPPMAIPDLTDLPGYWGVAVPESLCAVGSELEFWVSHGGSIHVSACKTQRKLFTGVDLRQPLWAVVDVYGQTCSVLLQGSHRKGFVTSRSCPAPKDLPLPQYSSLPDGDTFSLSSNTSAEHVCVVCLLKEADVWLPCGHQCLCRRCSQNFLQQFDICPLCRSPIRPEEMSLLSSCDS